MKRDQKALQRRRLRAARLLEQGLPQAEVARRVGVSRQSVNTWAKKLEAEGLPPRAAAFRDALRAAFAPDEGEAPTATKRG